MSVSAAVYVRVSTTRQGADGTSLATQEERCRAYAAEHDYAVNELHVFQDIQSGGDLFTRPGLRRLRQAVDAGEVQVVIAYALDRLTRDQTHLGVLVNLLEEAGARLEFVTESFDDTPVGKFIRSAQAFAAEMERVKGIERSGRARLARVAAGKPLVGNRPPYGYRWNADKSALLVDPATAPIVRRIFVALAVGSSLHSVAAELTNGGIPTPSGTGRWWYTTIQAFVQHPIYCGKPAAFRYRTEKAKDGTRRQRCRPVSETVPLSGIAPALVTEQEWQAVQERLAYNRRWIRRAPREPEAALLRGGFVRCGDCGRPLIVARARNGAYNYRCGGKNQQLSCPQKAIRAHLLDTPVWHCIEQVLRNPKLIADRLIELRAQPPDTLALRAIDKIIADLDRQQRNFIRAIAELADEEATAPLAAELTSISKRRTKAIAEREALAQQQQQWEAAQDRLHELEHWCEVVAAQLAAFDYAKKRTALAALDVRVALFTRDHEPRWELQFRIDPRQGDAVIEQDRQRTASLVSSSPTRSTCSPPPPCRPQSRPSPNCRA